LDFVKKGENFLEYKQEQLMEQINHTWSDYKNSQNNFYDLYRKTLLALNNTYKEMGKRRVKLISKISEIQFKPSITIKYKKDIGILFHYINYELKQEKNLPSYSFDYTSPQLDELILILKDFIDKLILFAEKEDNILKLVFNFKKISRRINGLKNVIKPELESNIRTIKNTLEELDRENFVRLKKTKNLVKKQIIT